MTSPTNPNIPNIPNIQNTLSIRPSRTRQDRLTLQGRQNIDRSDEVKPWWERWPGRLEDEIDRLRKAGIETELHKELFDKGIALLKLRHSIKGEKQNFVVAFPDVYPYTRFEVYAPQLTLCHHQNPFTKSLCMIGRSTVHWHTTDTVADYMINRLPKVIQAGESTDSASVEQVEEIQGEPITDYYPYAPNHVVLINSSWAIDASTKKGFLKIGADRSNQKFAVLAVMDSENHILAEAEPEISDLYTDQIFGKWVRSQEPIVEKDHRRFLAQLMQLDKALINGKTLIAASTFIIGVIFPEEVKWRENRDGWLFLIVQRRRKTG